MNRADTGRIRRRPSFVRIVKATNNGLPAFVSPTAIKRSSSHECFGSGATRGPCTNKVSISAIYTPCCWHLERLPSSQSNPPACKFIVTQYYTYVYTFGCFRRAELERPKADVNGMGIMLIQPGIEFRGFFLGESFDRTLDVFDSARSHNSHLTRLSYGQGRQAREPSLYFDAPRACSSAKRMKR
jgi:hypothetical protein